LLSKKPAHPGRHPAEFGSVVQSPAALNVTDVVFFGLAGPGDDLVYGWISNEPSWAPIDVIYLTLDTGFIEIRYDSGAECPVSKGCGVECRETTTEGRELYSTTDCGNPSLRENGPTGRVTEKDQEVWLDLSNFIVEFRDPMLILSETVEIA